MYSPWGEVQQSTSICRGLLWVSTPGHGGLMVAKGFAGKHLSSAAQKRGIEYGNYICFEEDCDWEIVAFELKSLHRDRFMNKKSGVILENYDREKNLISLSYFHADYLLDVGVEPVEPAFTHYKKSKLSDQMRKDKHSDLVVCAWGIWSHDKGDGVVKVLTADDVEHLVTRESYERRDHDLPLLSDCEIIKEDI